LRRPGSVGTSQPPHLFAITQSAHITNRPRDRRGGAAFREFLRALAVKSGGEQARRTSADDRENQLIPFPTFSITKSIGLFPRGAK
jgi:hypothetical protein